MRLYTLWRAERQCNRRPKREKRPPSCSVRFVRWQGSLPLRPALPLLTKHSLSFLLWLCPVVFGYFFDCPGPQTVCEPPGGVNMFFFVHAPRARRCAGRSARRLQGWGTLLRFTLTRWSWGARAQMESESTSYTFPLRKVSGHKTRPMPMG
jgi:hypothetical protein